MRGVSNNLKKIDPRIKLALLTVLITEILVLPSRHFSGFGCLLLYLTVLVIISRLPLADLIRRVSAIIPLFLFFFILRLLFYQQNLYQQLPFLSNLILRTSLILTALALFFHTTPFPLFIKSLASIKTPPLILNILFFTHRFIFVLLKEGETLYRARQCRIGGTESFRSRIEGASLLIRQLLMNIIQRSDYIYISMLSRGYQRHLPFLELKTSRPQDVLILFLILLFHGVVPILP